MDWKLSLAGLLIGGLVGLTGMGGGSLMTPLLVIVFGFSPTVAIGTDLAHGAIFKTAGAARHRRLGTVHARLSGWMFLGSAPFSILGVWLATRISATYGDGAQSVMSRLLACALVLGALGLAAKSFIRYHEHSDAPFLLRRRDRIAAVAIGAIGGLIVGLTSVGTGVFFGLSMLFLLPAPLGQGRGDGHLPRGRPAVGRGVRPLHRRQRGFRRGRLAAHRLDPRASSSRASSR